MKKYFSSNIQFILITLLGTALFSVLWLAMPVNIYQSRDITRALEVLSGSLITYGPELSGGGFLPGGFYYYLLAVPLAFGLGWISVWWEMLVLSAAGIALAFSWIKRISSPHYGFLLFVLYFTSHYFIISVNVFMNPAYIPLFVFLTLGSLLQTFDEGKSESAKKKNWIFACLCMGLGLQLHFTMIFLFLAALLLGFFSSRLRLPRLDDRSFYLGLGTFVVTLLPFGIWKLLRLNGIHIGLDPGNISGIESESSFFLYQQLLYELKHLGVFLILSRVSEMLLIPQLLSIVAASVSVKLIFRKNTEKMVSVIPLRSSFIVAGICSFVTFIPCLYTFAAAWGFRYSIVFSVCYPCFIVLTVLIADQKFNIQKVLLRNLLALLFFSLWLFFRNDISVIRETFSLYSPLTFVAIGMISVFLWMTFKERFRSYFLLGVSGGTVAILVCCFCLGNFTFKYLGGERPTIDEMRTVGKIIRQRAGWNYEEARYHILYINKDYDLDYRLIETFNDPVVAKPSENIDGFIVGLIKPELNFTETNPLDWLVKNRLARTVASAISSGSMKLLRADVKGRVVIIPYAFTNPAASMPILQNHGVPYEYHRSVLPTPTGHTAAYGEINDCPGHPDWCSVRVLLQERREKNGAESVEVSIVGIPMSQSTEWIVPDWTEGLIRPHIHLMCPGGTQTLYLAHTIGFTYDGNIWTQNHSIIAPFTIRFPHPCPGKLTESRFGFEDAEIAADGKFFNLGKRETVLKRKF